MTCHFEQLNDGRWRCPRCGYVSKRPMPQPPHKYCPADGPRPSLVVVDNEGPGTELHNLIAELGITPDASCGCEAMRRKMNAWGPDGCRLNKPEILDHLRTAYTKTDWPIAIRAAAAGATTIAIALPLSTAMASHPLHPIQAALGALVDLAIRRAEFATASLGSGS